ncbi:hypothetical protein CYLTODRAFT_459484 [Cylindrobasidium torrendii FP15055 ss-10]|uniref:Uncharacterized protein n=1 Tax=Cylindrobasidium torrendii FP15055 ss-10 TaxID=1314674 RepID=A0A0D7AV46_9AGAR|nr:hypothetical protein CYLTODRAFT_459484 [Cylindrobasidium torrendii FP15055 ss-10]
MTYGISHDLSFTLPRPPSSPEPSTFRIVRCEPAVDNRAISFRTLPYTAKACSNVAQKEYVDAFLADVYLAALAGRFSAENTEPTICYPLGCPSKGCEGEMVHFVQVGGPGDHAHSVAVVSKFRLIIWCETCGVRLRHCYAIPAAALLQDEGIKAGLLRRASLEDGRRRLSRARSAVATLEYRGIHKEPKWPVLSIAMITARKIARRRLAKDSVLGVPDWASPDQVVTRPLPSYKRYDPVRPPKEESVYRLRFTIFLWDQVHEGWWMWDRAGKALNGGPEIHLDKVHPDKAHIYLLTTRRPWLQVPWIVPGRLVERYDYYELKWVRWSPARPINLDLGFETVVVFTVERSAISWAYMQGTTDFEWDPKTTEWTSSMYHR